MRTMVGGNGAKCTVCGTTTPTPMLKLTLETRGALPPWITVCRISVLCCSVRLTTGAVAELVEEVPAAWLAAGRGRLIGSVRRCIRPGGRTPGRIGPVRVAAGRRRGSTRGAGGAGSGLLVRGCGRSLAGRAPLAGTGCAARLALDRLAVRQDRGKYQRGHCDGGLCNNASCHGSSLSK